MVTLAKVTKRANRKAMEESAKLMNRLVPIGDLHAGRPCIH